MVPKTVLISGAGIAGPTLAYWLHKSGFSPTIIEHAPSFRTGGYVIDFWGLGYDIAERMELISGIERLGYHIQDLRIVDDEGWRITGFGTKVFRDLTGGRFVTVPRSDLAHLLLERAQPTTEILFDDSIKRLNQDGNGVKVTFEHAAPRSFDIVIGADGLHSNVRQLSFGPQDQFERSLGYTVAAFQSSGYRPRDNDIYIMHNEPGRMLGRVAGATTAPCFFLCSQTPRLNPPQHRMSRHRRQFCGGGTAAGVGRLRKSLMSWNVRTIFTSIA